MKHFVILVSLLCCIFSAVLVNARDLTPHEREARVAFDAAFEIRSTQSLEAALESYLAVRKEYSETFYAGAASNDVARFYIEHGDTTKALEYYQWTLDNFSDIPDSALVEYSPLAHNYPERTPYLNAIANVAEIYYEQRRYAEAKAIYQMMMDRNMSGGMTRIHLQEEDYLFIRPYAQKVDPLAFYGVKWAVPSRTDPKRYIIREDLKLLGQYMVYLIENKYEKGGKSK